LGVLGALLKAEGALANGALPAVSQLLTDPAAPDHLYLRSTFGLLVTSDGGANWDWLCEEGMGYQDLEPPMVILPGGSILLATPDGVSRSDPSGCDFGRAEGLDQTVVDLSRIPAEPGSAVAVSLAGAVSTLWISTDEGRSFTPVGEPIQGLLASTVDVAASNPKVIYLSGLDGTQGVLLRSKDRGKTFETFPVPNTTTGRRPYIAAVSPEDEATVYVRLVGVRGELQVTRDGGKSFTTVLETTIAVKGFALSPDGSTVLASNDFDGTFRAKTSDHAFERIACGGHACLSWSDSGLFGCGDDMVDGYIVGRSDDLGASFGRVLDMPCVRGPLACDPSTSIGAACPLAWTTVSEQIRTSECGSREVPAPYTGCFASGAGGAPDTAGGANENGGSITAGSATSNAGNGGAAGAAPRTGNCGCRSAGAGPSTPAWSLALAAAWLVRRRRAPSRARAREA
jgi:MYXO-CTERM domain-containing protein